MAEKNWIKLYGAVDATPSYHMEEVHTYIAEFDSTKSTLTLNEIAQLHNIVKYLRLSGIEINDKEKAFQGTARKIISCYFAERGLDDLSEEYAKLYRPYREDFWAMFVDYKVIKKSSVVQLESFAKANDIYIGSFLAQKAMENCKMKCIRK